MGIGRKLDALIKDSDFNVLELARKVDVSPQTIYSMIKRDNKKADIEVLLRIARTFGVPPEYFIEGDDPAPSAPASPSLADHEEALLHVYRQLNDEGQEKVRGYTEDLAASGRYIKTGSADMVEEK